MSVVRSIRLPFPTKIGLTSMYRMAFLFLRHQANLQGCGTLDTLPVPAAANLIDVRRPRRVVVNFVYGMSIFSSGSSCTDLSGHRAWAIHLCKQVLEACQTYNSEPQFSRQGRPDQTVVGHGKPSGGGTYLRGTGRLHNHVRFENLTACYLVVLLEVRAFLHNYDFYSTSCFIVYHFLYVVVSLFIQYNSLYLRFLVTLTVVHLNDTRGGDDLAKEDGEDALDFADGDVDGFDLPLIW